MCGLAGVMGIDREDAVEAAGRMRRAMAHRGPDDDGIEVIDDPEGKACPIVLAHTRLSILDVSSSGHQPMHDGAVTRNWVVYNGEIYNYRELQTRLAGDGHPCQTQCDTEVILRGYRAWGIGGIERLRGMYAFCLVDAGTRRAWLCRDRLGIKPLYYARAPGGGVLFASELRALLAAGPDLLPRNLRPSAVESFLSQGAVQGGDAIVEGVRMVPPGSIVPLGWDRPPDAIRSYWQLPFRTRVERHSRRSAVQRLSRRLRDAVALHLRSDVPLGLFLSGGVDSAALATLATEVADTRVVTMTVGFDEAGYDESKQARAIARELGTEHHTLTLTGEDVLKHIDDAFAAVDQPTVDGFNTYFVSRAARQAGLKVALSGVGGDELFGGYASFRDVPRAMRLGHLLRLVGPIAAPAIQALASRAGRAGVKAAELRSRDPSSVSAYLLRRELFLPSERRALQPLPPGVDAHLGLPEDLTFEMRAATRGLDIRNQVSLLELSSYMRHMLLRDADVFSMAHGLELRVPLLDHEVVAEAVSLPGRWKGPDPRPKPLLVDAVGPRLPRSSYTAKKRGFTFPWDSWLRGALSRYAADRLLDHEQWEALGMHPQVPAELWKRFQQEDPRVQGLQILGLLVLSNYASRHGLEVAA